MEHRSVWSYSCVPTYKDLACTRVKTMSICPNLYFTALEAPGTQALTLEAPETQALECCSVDFFVVVIVSTTTSSSF